MSRGIYKIMCAESEKFYIGSSENIEGRWIQHKSRLKHNRHENIYMQRTYNKYGPDCFEYSIVEIVDEMINLLTIEQKYLDELKPLLNIGKQSSGGDNISNNPNREDIISRMTKSINDRYAKMTPEERKCMSRPGESNPNWKGGSSFSVCQCGKKIAKYDKSCMKCRDINGENNPFFNKHHSVETKLKISNIHKNNWQNLSDEEKQIKKPNMRKVKIDNIVYLSCAEASRKLGIHIMTICYRVKSEYFPNYQYCNQTETGILIEG